MAGRAMGYAKGRGGEGQAGCKQHDDTTGWGEGWEEKHELSPAQAT